MREKRQKEAVTSWLQSKRNSIIYASPRMGKTKIGIEIIKDYGKVLVSYPNLPIKESWDTDIQKWGSGGAYPTFSTFLSLSKALEEPWDLVVLDEVHMLSEAQIEALKAYKLIHKSDFLGLSGTISDETKNTLDQELNMDIAYHYPIELAVKEGIISDYEITVHKVPLDNQVVNKYYKKQIKRTEKQQFDSISKTIDYFEASGKATFYKRLERMRIIQNSLSKLLRTKQLCSNERVLVFCGTTNIADQLGCAVYHNKSNDKDIFDKFCSGTINQLAVCKMLNMGVTINNLDRVIINYTDSNSENLIQKICRCLNYDYHNKTAVIDIVSSDEPVEIRWIKKALDQLDKSKITWI